MQYEYQYGKHKKYFFNGLIYYQNKSFDIDVLNAKIMLFEKKTVSKIDSPILFNSLINIVDSSTAIHGVLDIIFDTPLSNTNAASGVTQSACLTKIDSSGKLNVFHPYTLLLPNKLQGFWVVLSITLGSLPVSLLIIQQLN